MYEMLCEHCNGVKLPGPDNVCHSRILWDPLVLPFSEVGIELTDSIYVVLNMAIMTRMWAQAFSRALGDEADDFGKRPPFQMRISMRNETLHLSISPRTTRLWSVNSGYGGNVLLGKKCFALRIASYLGQKRGLDGRAYADSGH